MFFDLVRFDNNIKNPNISDSNKNRISDLLRKYIEILVLAYKAKHNKTNKVPKVNKDETLFI